MMPSDQNLLIRWATRWDREAVIDLMARLAEQHGVETTRKALVEAFEEALKHPDEMRFCVAVRDDVIVGQASLHRAYSTWRASHFGTIEDVYVVEEARRQGVARALLDFMVAQARRRGYCRLSLHVLADNEPAREFYGSYGMQNDGYVVYELALDEQQN